MIELNYSLLALHVQPTVPAMSSINWMMKKIHAQTNILMHSLDRRVVCVMPRTLAADLHFYFIIQPTRSGKFSFGRKEKVSVFVVFLIFSLNQRHDVKMKFRSNAPLISFRCLCCYCSLQAIEQKPLAIIASEVVEP